MDASATVAVSAAVVGLTQLAKWAGVQDKYGPIAVMVLSGLGVAMWGYSVGTFERAQMFGYFSAWIAVSTGAAGLFGFTRASASAVTAIKAPPTGAAGASPTVKD